MLKNMFSKQDMKDYKQIFDTMFYDSSNHYFISPKNVFF